MMEEARRIREAVSPRHYRPRTPQYSLARNSDGNNFYHSAQDLHYQTSNSSALVASDHHAIGVASKPQSQGIESMSGPQNLGSLGGQPMSVPSTASLSLSIPKKQEPHPAVLECERLKEAMKTLALEADNRIQEAEKTSSELRCVIDQQHKESELLQGQMRKLIVHKSTFEAQLHQKFLAAQSKASKDDSEAYHKLKTQLKQQYNSMIVKLENETKERLAAAETAANQKWRHFYKLKCEDMVASMRQDNARLRLSYQDSEIKRRRNIEAQVKALKAAWRQVTADHRELRKKANALASTVRASRKQYSLLKLEFKELSHFSSGLIRALEHNMNVERVAKEREEKEKKKEAEFDHHADLEYFNKRRLTLHTRLER